MSIRRAVEAAHADAEAVEAIRDQVRVTVARNCVTVCAANRSIAAARHVVDVQSETLEEIRRLFRGGRSTVFDVTRAETAVSQSTASIPPIIAQRQAALSRAWRGLGVLKSLKPYTQVKQRRFRTAALHMTGPPGAGLEEDSSLAGPLVLFESCNARLEFIVMSAVLTPLGPRAFSLDAASTGAGRSK